MSGGSTPATSTTTNINPYQQQLEGMAMPFLQQFASKPPQLPTGGTLAPVDPLQTQGQNLALGAAGGPQSNLAGTGANMSQFLSGDVLYPGSNPALSQYMTAAELPIEQQLTESTLPNIRSGAAGAGQFGGTRQGIAEGIASRGASQAEGLVGADIASKGYGQGLQALTQNLALLPQTIQEQLAPALTTSGVGDVRQQQAQAALQEKNLYETYPQLLPLLMGQTLAGIGAGMPSLGTQTTATSSQQDPLMQALGLGISGLGAIGGGKGIAALLPFLAA